MNEKLSEINPFKTDTLDNPIKDYSNLSNELATIKYEEFLSQNTETISINPDELIYLASNDKVKYNPKTQEIDDPPLEDIGLPSFGIGNTFKKIGGFFGKNIKNNDNESGKPENYDFNRVFGEDKIDKSNYFSIEKLGEDIKEAEKIKDIIKKKEAFEKQIDNLDNLLDYLERNFDKIKNSNLKKEYRESIRGLSNDLTIIIEKKQISNDLNKQIYEKRTIIRNYLLKFNK